MGILYAHLVSPETGQCTNAGNYFEIGKISRFLRNKFNFWCVHGL